MEEIVRAVCQADPPPPSAAAATRSGASELRGDLDTIVMKALRKEPGRRYPSAQALAEDVQRHLDGLTVRARPDTLQYRAAKFVSRHRGLVAATVLAALALSGGLVATLRQARVAEGDRQRAERRLEDARGVAEAACAALAEAAGVPPAGPGQAQRRQEALAKCHAARAAPGPPPAGTLAR